MAEEVTVLTEKEKRLIELAAFLFWLSYYILRPNINEFAAERKTAITTAKFFNVCPVKRRIIM
ncbi:MAG: hypothetical protein ACRC3B_03145, partial [Bacteroidia bacterium]